MKKNAGYKTKQRQAILGYLTEKRDEHLTAKQICGYFAKAENPIGLTTIYRRLEELEKLGQVRRYSVDGGSACFQLIGEDGSCHEHFHLVCEQCGRLFHMECGYLEGVSGHILEEHGFQVNPLKIMFYGICRECREKQDSSDHREENSVQKSG